MVIPVVSRFARRLRGGGGLKPPARAVRAVLEPLERRILLTWIGAVSGNTNDQAHDYNYTGNWSSGVVENSLAGATLTGNTTLYFAASVATGAGGLNLGYSGNYGLTLMSASTTAETLTLGGDISTGVANQTITIGDVTNTDDLNVNLGAASRTFNTASGENLVIANVVSAAHAVTAAGSGTLTLSGANTFSGGATLSSGQLNINSSTAVGSGRLTIDGGTTIDNTSGATVTLGAIVQTWSGDFAFVGSNNLNLGTGAVTLGASRTVTVSAGILSDGGVIGDGGSGYSVTKAGAGTLALSGANTFSGGTTLSAGQLNINSPKAVGSGTFTINGGTIDNTSGAAVTLSNNNVQSWDGDFTFVGSYALNLGTGAVTLDANRTVTVSGSTLTAGAVGDGGNNYNLTKAGSGTLALTASGTYGGGTSIDAGILSFANGALGSGSITFVASSTLQWNGANTQDVSSEIQAIASGVIATFDTNGNNVTLASALGGSGGIAKVGAGALTLSGNNNFSGGATVSVGTLNINTATAIGSGTFTIDNGVTINNSSGSAITLSNNNALDWAGSFTFTGSSALNLGTGAVTLGTNLTATVSASTLTVGGAIGDGGNGYLLTKAGNGTLTLSGANTFSGGTKLSAGELIINSATAVGSGTFTINGGTIDNTSGATITLSNNNALTWGASFTFTGSNSLNLGMGAVTLGANVTATVSASTLTVGGAIGDGGSGYKVTKAGNGTLTLTGNNTFSGGTTLSAGELIINSATAVGSGTFTVNGGTIDNTSGAAITLSNNNALSWGASFTFVGSNNLNLGTGAVTLTANHTVTTSASMLTIGGAIGDGGNGYKVTKAGTGTLTLSGNNTFSGGTTLSAGQLNIDSATAVGSGTFTVSGGTIDNTSGAAITLSNNNNQSWGASFTFDGSNNLNLGTGTVTLTTNPTVTIDAGMLTVGGVISGAKSLTEAGAGTLTLSGANTFSNGMTLSAGQLNIDSAAAVGTGTFTISGGTIDNASGAAITLSNNNAQTWSGSFTFVGSNNLNLGTGAVSPTGNPTVTIDAGMLTVGGVISGAHSLTEAGAGTLTLSGANTFSNGMTLSAGQLNIDSATAIGTGTFTINGGSIDNTSGAAITLSSNNTQTWGASFTFLGSNSLALGPGAVTLTGGRTVTINAAMLTVGGIISGAYPLTEAGAGTLTLVGANTFSGGMTLSAGQLNIDNAKAVGSGTFTIDGGTIDNTSGATITLSNNNPQNWDGGFTFVGSKALNLGTGAVTLGASQTVTTNASTLTVGGVVGDGGNGYGITKAGAGTLVLNGADTFSGTTTINAGVAQLGNANAAQNSTVSVGTANGLAFSTAIGSFTIGGLAGGSNEALTDVGAGAVTLTVGNNGSTNVYSGILSGSGAITISGGAETLSGVNTYSGGTTLATGAQLNIGNAAAIGTGNFTINGGTIDNTSGGAITLSNNNTQTWRSFTFAGSSALNLGTGAVTLEASDVVTVSGNTLTVGGAIGDGGNGYSLTEAGTGTLTLTGSNTFSGGATIDSGTLLANNASGSATGSGPVSVSSGATLGGTGTVSGSVTVNSGGTLAPGAGGTSIFNTGNLILASGSDLDIVLNGNTAGTEYDQVNVTGTVAVTGSILNLSGTRSAHDSTVLTLINNDAADAITGTFQGVAEGASTTFGAVTYTASYVGGTGNDMVLTADPAATTVTVTSGTNPSVFGQSVTFTAEVTSTSSGTPTGTATFMDGTTTLGTSTLDASSDATFSTSIIAAGSQSITVIYGGDTNFATDTSSALSQTVDQDGTSSTVSSSVDPSVFGQSVTFTATVTADSPGSGTPTGTVTFDDGMTTLGTGTLDGSGVATFSTSSLALNSHSITAVYGGDTNFTTSTSSAVSQTVDQDGTSSTVSSSVNPSVFGQSVTFTATVTADSPGSGTPTGTVTFDDGMTTLGTGTLDGSGVATFSTSSLALNSHSITAVYGGDTNFTTSTSSALSQTVDQDGTSSTVSSSVNPSVFGQSVTFTATVTANAPGAGTPTGTVTFDDGATTLGTGTLDGSGVATFSTSSLALNSHSITAVYGGDTNFTTSTSPALSQTVDQDGTSSAVSSSVDPSVFGQSVTFTATVTADSPGSGTPTGTVTFDDGMTTLGTGTLDGSGVATFSTSSLALNSHSITAVYGGDTNFTTSTSSAVSQTVDQDGTSSAVSSSVDPSVFGQSVTFTATVTADSPGSGTPTGTVTFDDGMTTLGTGTLDGSGVATFSTSSLALNSHSITAVYGGDTNFTTSTSSAVSQTVDQDGTSSTVSSSVNPSVFGQSVTFTATVTANAPGAGTPTGTVTFDDGATTLGTGTLDGSGVATFSTSSLALNSHSITAVYGGDTNFTTSTSSALSQTVDQDGTSSAVSSSANPSVFGQSVTFTATVTANAPGAGTPTGTVTFDDGATTLGTGTLDGSGVATFSTSALALNSHSITAVYGGDTNFTTSTSTAASQTVDQDGTGSTVSSSANPSVFGQSVTFTATVTASLPGSGTPTGTVTFDDGMTTLGTGTLDGSGVATFSTSALALNSHSISVVYGGDTNFTTSTSSALSQTVDQDGTSSAVSSSVNPSVFGQSVTFTATVTANSPGSGTPTGTVTFDDGATTLGTGTLNGSGVATFSTSALALNSHSITAVYGGDTNFTTSTSTAASQTVDQDGTGSTVSSSANPSVFGQSVTFTATVTADSPGSGTPTGTVTFDDGMTTLGTGTLDGSGVATFSTSDLGVGPHSITAVYDGDANFPTSASSALAQTVGQAATTATVAASANPSEFDQPATFTATVTANAPGSGTPSGMVTFEDGSATLGTETLDGAGQAIFSTSSLSVGSHSITVVYGGDGNFTGGTSSVLTQGVVQLPPAQLTFAQQPSGATAGTSTAPLTIDVKDQFGNLVSVDSSDITLSLVSGPAGAELAGTLQAPVQNGVATFSNVQMTRAGVWVLAASTTNGIVADAAPITVSPGPPTQTAVMAQPSASWQFGTISPNMVIALTDQFGNIVAATGSSITASIASGPAGAILSGTTTVPVVDGYATFDSLSVNLPGTYSFTFAAGGDAPAVISGVQIVSIPARRYLFNGAPLSTRSIVAQQQHNAPAIVSLGPPPVTGSLTVVADSTFLNPDDVADFQFPESGAVSPISFNFVTAPDPNLLRQLLDSNQ